MTPGCGMIEPAVSPSRTTSKPLAARKAASAAPKPWDLGVCPSVLDTRFTPWRRTTRPEASVSHLPTWPIGSEASRARCEAGTCSPVADAGDAKEQAKGTGNMAMNATTILLIRVLMVHSPCSPTTPQRSAGRIALYLVRPGPGRLDTRPPSPPC